MSTEHRTARFKLNIGLRGALAALIFIGLTACSILPKTEPVTFYRLPSAEVIRSATARPLALTVRIKQPDSNGLLAGNRIAVIPTTNQLSAYQGARWATSVPVLFRDQVLDAWRQSGLIAHVINDSQSLSADRELTGSLNAFQSEYRQGQPRVVIQFDAQWLDPNSRTLLASRRFDVTEPAANSNVPAVVAAFGVAQARLSQQLLEWVLAMPAR
ncbi:ABC-type transport auxiliary lipoprotein family protein [Oceanisphaera sp. W20_SRM_FM3]|uniref:ABC-type transport auxiliary lipoprotein family protein n=1 Tax=Oceanisphaera sp. W20_SRM_FM3 TaxID=3240267 RepID=UPI003F982DBD